jgi:hypothetical protein
MTLYNRNISQLEQARDGLDFVMEMLHVDNTHRLPRNILTGAAHRPYIVNSRDETMMYFEASLYEDCYMSVYPNYEVMIENGDLPPDYKPVPNHIMIDLDREHFNSDAELEEALAETLKNIKANITGLSGEHPIIVASGNGYHAHVPLPGLTTALQDMPEFEAFKEVPDLADKFLRFTERRLSNNKADHRHNPSINSCMFRVPGTYNTKAKAAGRNPLVRVVQGYEYLKHRTIDSYSLPELVQDIESKSRPTTKFLNDFYAYLVQEQINNQITRSERRLRSLENDFSDLGGNGSNNNSIWWIDRLLSIGVEDERKDLMFWVLAPYLIMIKKVGYDKAYQTLEEWLVKCNDVRRLVPGWSYFRGRIEYCLKDAEKKERKPDGIGAFQEYYPELYEMLFKGLLKE